MPNTGTATALDTSITNKKRDKTFNTPAAPLKVTFHHRTTIFVARRLFIGKHVYEWEPADDILTTPADFWKALAVIPPGHWAAISSNSGQLLSYGMDLKKTFRIAIRREKNPILAFVTHG